MSSRYIKQRSDKGAAHGLKRCKFEPPMKPHTCDHYDKKNNNHVLESTKLLNLSARSERIVQEVNKNINTQQQFGTL